MRLPKLHRNALMSRIYSDDRLAEAYGFGIIHDVIINGRPGVIVVSDNCDGNHEEQYEYVLSMLPGFPVHYEEDLAFDERTGGYFTKEEGCL